MERLSKKIRILIIPSKKNNYRPYFLLSNFLFSVVLALVVLKLVSFSFLCFFPKGFLFSAVNRSMLLSLTNQRRSSSGILTLEENSKLNQAAYLKAKDMIAYDYFSHTSPSGKTPWYWLSKVNYNYQYAGENLAIDFVESEELFQAWYSSSTHKANIINPKFQDIGMAVVSGNFKGRRTTVVVQYFGKKLAVSSAYAREKQSTTTKKISSVSKGKTVTRTYKKPASTPGGITLYKYYARKGRKLPSIKERAVLYEKLGLGKASSYYGADWQNALLVNKLITLGKKESSVPKKEQKVVPKIEKKETAKENFFQKKAEEKNTTFKFSEKTTEPEANKPTIEKPSFISKAKEKSNSFVVRFLNFFARNYNGITRMTFLSAFLIVFVSLCIDVLVKIRIQHKDIILRGTIYSIILFVLFLLDKSIILKMLPHSLGIL